MKALALKWARYAAVSVVSTTVTLSLLGAMVYSGVLSPGWANVVATAAGTVPSFELNRRWVWSKTGHRSLGKEITPFCALSFLGLGLSTLMVSLAAGRARASGMGHTGVAITSDLASMFTFGALWVVQYFLLDKVLFRRAQAPRPSIAEIMSKIPAGSAGRPRQPRENEPMKVHKLTLPELRRRARRATATVALMAVLASASLGVVAAAEDPGKTGSSAAKTTLSTTAITGTGTTATAPSTTVPSTTTSGRNTSATTTARQATSTTQATTTTVAPTTTTAPASTTSGAS